MFVEVLEMISSLEQLKLRHVLRPIHVLLYTVYCALE